MSVWNDGTKVGLILLAITIVCALAGMYYHRKSKQGEK